MVNNEQIKNSKEDKLAWEGVYLVDKNGKKVSVKEAFSGFSKMLTKFAEENPMQKVNWKEMDQKLLEKKECDFQTPTCSKNPIEWADESIFRKDAAICDSCCEWLNAEIEKVKKDDEYWLTPFSKIPQIKKNLKFYIK